MLRWLVARDGCGITGFQTHNHLLIMHAHTFLICFKTSPIWCVLKQKNPHNLGKPACVALKGLSLKHVMYSANSILSCEIQAAVCNANFFVSYILHFPDMNFPIITVISLAWTDSVSACVLLILAMLAYKSRMIRRSMVYLGHL